MTMVRLAKCVGLCLYYPNSNTMRQKITFLPFLLAILGLIVFLIPGCSDDDTKPGYGTATDIDGHVYQTVVIGDQEWMAENLRVTRYNNADLLDTGLSDAAWRDTKEGAYVLFDHQHENADGINTSEEMLEAYGKLYNWYAVDDARGLCLKVGAFPVMRIGRS